MYKPPAPNCNKVTSYTHMVMEPPQAPTQSTTTKPKAKKSSKPSQSQSAGQPAATSKPPPASSPVPTLKDPVSWINKIYYDLVFLIKAWGNLDAMVIQCLYLREFLSTICHIDKTAVLLPYKSFFALNEEVLYEPNKLRQSCTAVSKYIQEFCFQHIMDKMYVSVLVAFNSTPEDFCKSLCPDMGTLAITSTLAPSKPLSSQKLAGCFIHMNTWTSTTSQNFWRLLYTDSTQMAPLSTFGLQFKNIWDGYKTPKATPFSTAGAPNATPLAQPKHQIVCAVHVEVAKEHKSAAIILLHKALCTKAFQCTTNLVMKCIPLFSNCLPSMEQDIICCTITKQALCLAEFKYVSNPHIDLIDEPCETLKNHSLCSIILSYRHSWKKTFLSIDRDHSTGQVTLTYPRKYQCEANGCAHHLVKYMEYEIGTPALR